MQYEFNLEAGRRFLNLAVQRKLLTTDQAAELLRQAQERSTHPAQIALDSDLLKTVEVEIIEALAAPTKMAPGYELRDVLGYGALGVVYVAHQPRLQRDVAIKSIMQSRLSQQNVAARFRQEGAAIGRLQHPNIVAAYDSGSHQNYLYLVMELVKGADLSQLLKSGPIELNTALSIVRQTASGLAHALSHQIIHRDIKPGNLILTDAPAGFDLPPGVPLVKIADFGLARLNFQTDSEDDATRLTMTGAALGTPMYCAPEQLTGDAIDHRADIFALGATFFHAITGEPPLKAEKVSQVVAAKITGQQPRMELLPVNLDSRIQQLLLGMMAHDPDDRIPDYEQLIDRIDGIQTASTSVSVPVPVSPAPSGKWKIGLAAAVALLVMSLVYFVPKGLVNNLRQVESKPSLFESQWRASLFDGQDSSNWAARLGGVETLDTDEGSVLEVTKGYVVRQLEPLPVEYRGLVKGQGFRVSVGLSDADRAEVHFGFEGDGYDTSRRVVASFSKSVITLGTRDRWNGVLTEVSTLPPPTFSPDKPFHELRIDLYPDRWLVRFGTQVLGSVSVNPEANNQAMQLVVPEGAATFGDMEMFMLIEDRAKDPLLITPDQID